MKYLFAFAITVFFIYTLSAATVDFSSSNLPIVIIDTHGQAIPYDDPRIVADMGIIYNGPGQRNDTTDAFNNYDGKISIEIRGQSSAGWDKKSYGLETQNDDGSNRNVSLIDLPEENDWILYAPYYDRSLMLNALTFHLTREMGRYASRTRYCELLLNGEYKGVYVLMEKIKRDKNRVDIAKLNPGEISGDDVTGGYILKVDKEPWKAGFDSPYPPFEGATEVVCYQYHYPKADDIVIEQETYIKSFIFEFENLMHDSVYTDPVSGYVKYLNVASFIDYALINELSRNVDGYRLSAYFYKEKDSDGGKLFAGPVWDYNFSFGNVDYYDSWKTEGWQLIFFAEDENFHNEDSFFMPFWWKLLFTDSAFAGKLMNRWQDLRQTILSKNSINEAIDMFADITAEARVRNFEIWPGPGENDLGGGWFPGDPRSGQIDSYEDEINLLKSWISGRIDWMDENIPLLTSLAENKEKTMPVSFELKQNYPNPFNPKTVIGYHVEMIHVEMIHESSLHESSLHGSSVHVELSVYNLLGRKVQTLVNRIQGPGSYEVRFDGGNLSGGVYFYQLKIAGGRQITRKMLLLK